MSDSMKRAIFKLGCSIALAGAIGTHCGFSMGFAAFAAAALYCSVEAEKN